MKASRITVAFNAGIARHRFMDPYSNPSTWGLLFPLASWWPAFFARHQAHTANDNHP